MLIPPVLVSLTYLLKTNGLEGEFFRGFFQRFYITTKGISDKSLEGLFPIH